MGIPIKATMSGGEATGFAEMRPDDPMASNLLANYSSKNKFINANFGIWQRATSQVNMGGYCVDRHIGNRSNVTAPISRIDLGPANPTGRWGCRISVTATSGTHGCNFGQKIENVGTFSGQQVTLSLKAAADVAGKKLGVRVIQSFGAGGSATVTTEVGVFTLANTHSVQSLSFVVPPISGKILGSDNNDCLWIILDFADSSAHGGQLSGQLGVYDLDYWQLEVGPNSTHLDERDPAVEFMICQRFYQITSMQGVTGVTFTTNGDTRCTRNLRVKMRATPSFGYTGSLDVIGQGPDGTFLNINLGTLSVSASSEIVAIGGVSNIVPLQAGGGVVTWGDNRANFCNIHTDAEL